MILGGGVGDRCCFLVSGWAERAHYPCQGTRLLGGWDPGLVVVKFEKQLISHLEETHVLALVMCTVTLWCLGRGWARCLQSRCFLAALNWHHQ